MFIKDDKCVRAKRRYTPFAKRNILIHEQSDALKILVMRLSSWCVDVVVAYQSTTASSFQISSYISWRLTTFINQWCNSVTLDVDFIYYLFMNASKCCDLVHHQQKYSWYCYGKLYILFPPFLWVCKSYFVILCERSLNWTAQDFLNKTHHHGVETYW